MSKQRDGLTRNVGLAQTFDFSPLIEREVQKKKEKDAAIASVINDISDIDTSGVRQVDMTGMTREYEDLQDFVMENYEAISNPGKNPEVYGEYRKRKQMILRNVSLSKQAAKQEISLSEQLSSSDLYQARYQENTEFIKNLHNTSIYSSTDAGNVSMNEDFNTVLGATLKAGVSFNDLAKDYAKDIETDGNNFYVTQQNGEKLLVVQNGKISDENLATYAANVLASNKGSLALGEKFQYDGGFNNLSEEGKQAAINEFVNAMRPFLPEELKVSGLGDAEGYGDNEDLFVPRDRNLVAHMFGKASTSGLKGDSGTITASNIISVPLNDGTRMLINDYDTELGDGEKQERRSIVGFVDSEGNYSINKEGYEDMVSADMRYLVEGSQPPNEFVRSLNDNLNRESGKNEVSNEEYMKRWNASTMAEAIQNSINDKLDRGENVFNEHNVKSPVRTVLFKYSGDTSGENIPLNTRDGSPDLKGKFGDTIDSLLKEPDKAQSTIQIGIGDEIKDFTIVKMSGNKSFQVKYGGTVILDHEELTRDVITRWVSHENLTADDVAKISDKIYSKIYNGYLRKANFQNTDTFFDVLNTRLESPVSTASTPSAEEDPMNNEKQTIEGF